MDANFVQCVGELPWVGFIVGCILLGITLAWLIHRGVTGLVWLQEWRSRRRNKRYERAGLRQKKREARPGYWERRAKWENIWNTVGKWVGYTLLFGFLGTAGTWMIWGFARVIICMTST